ncbi:MULTISPECIES: MocR-like pyridoxine biosynthesis transcription factor PdxR [Paenibacillus]|uniref:MocR-like pyridoxine biosynthesis transcription factor PdxR n=1 Tax=Paenibacillus TaxID=44249 RepID=UPI0022B8ECF1|nr:PLP-dependent aminotransferase family protein [Paenibacillus caseinilyticus]MCZ8519630.1 PLP-dependent aminotransferase family protein [Paenibacillus caseinilyticus]
MLGIYLDSNSELSVTSQLCSQLRGKLQAGELTEGYRLPPSRRLAQEYGIARNIVLDVYEQLIAEGYLVGQTGSGTYVAGGLVTMHAGTSVGTESFDMPEPFPSTERPIDFMIGTPDLQHFPNLLWAKYLKAAAEYAPAGLFDYGDIRGEEDLRCEITSYLYRTRGMRCHPGQIIIVSGSSEGLSLIAQALSPSYRSVYMEDPTIDIAQHIFKHMQYGITPVPVDGSGMRLHEIERFQSGSLILLTPSHQFPTGSILSIQRRQLAVKLAEHADSYIIEDDYDGDFRLKGVPIPPLYTLSPTRVIYMGTFSKTLAPGLRIGFLVIPSHLVRVFADLKEELNLRSPSLAQAALARFMRDGRLDRHIHRMKGIYRQRRTRLIGAIHRMFGERMIILGDEAGMHFQVEYTGMQGPVDWQQSVTYGVKVYSVEDYCLIKGNHTRHILLGYGNTEEKDMEMGIERLHRFLEAFK